jgi:hypothetical protein
MLARRIPEDGDIVVRQETREGRSVYVLHTAPGPDQYVLGSRDECVAQAVTLAQLESVRAWVSAERDRFILLNDCRPRRR